MRKKASYRAAGIIHKIQNPADAEIEYLKTKYIFRNRRMDASFGVANPVEFDQNAGRIGFDFIEGLVPLKFGLCLPDERTKICTLAAEALASIHCVSEEYNGARVFLPSSIEIPGGVSCFIHGDYNLQNVCWSLSDQGIVVLDWSLAPIFKSRASHGTPYFDLGWFVYDIFSQSIFRFPSINDPSNCACAFLSAYFAMTNRLNSGFGVCLQEFLPYFRRLLLSIEIERRAELNYVFWNLDRLRNVRICRWIDHVEKAGLSGYRA